MHTFPHHRWRYFAIAVYAVCLAAVAGRTQEEEDSFRPVAAWVNESPIYEDESASTFAITSVIWRARRKVLTRPSGTPGRG